MPNKPIHRSLLSSKGNNERRVNTFLLFTWIALLSFGLLTHCTTPATPSEGGSKEKVGTTDAGKTQDSENKSDTGASKDSGATDAGNPIDANSQQDAGNGKEVDEPTDQGVAETTPDVPEKVVEKDRPDDGGEPALVPPFKQGVNVLFIGHSFFVPPSRGYNEIASHADHTKALPNHVYANVFAGGQNGAPGALWANAQRKKSILQKLNTGKVELLAMTAHLTDSEQKDYQNWIDAALAANKKTTFLISCPWPTGGSGAKAADFAKQNEQLAASLFQRVVALRKANPGVTIHYLNHGRVAVIVKSRFVKGSLKSATKSCCGNESVFRDTFGHGGDVIEKTAGLFFLSYLTGFTGLSPRVFPKLNAKEMESIVQEALKYNRAQGYLPKK